MKTKIIIGICILFILTACSKNPELSMQECTDSINGQYYLEECKQYKDYDFHYNLRKEWEANLPDSSYTIDRNYKECVWSNETYYFEYEPLSENVEHLLEVNCPVDSDILFGAVFCYKRAIRCNETWNYKNGIKEVYNFAG